MITIIIVLAIYNVGLVMSAVPISKFVAKYYPDHSRNKRGAVTIYLSLCWPYLLGLGIYKSLRGNDDYQRG